MRFSQAFSILAAIVLLAPGGVDGHSEREATFPEGTGFVPAHRPFDAGAEFIVVCKANSARLISAMDPGPQKRLSQALIGHCAHEHIQAAVDAVTRPGTNIYVLPGTYLEEPSLAPPPAGSYCAGVPDDDLIPYEDQARCPNVQNLIAIAADAGRYPAPCPATRDLSTPGAHRLCHLQIEGTGDDPMDVLIDAQWKKLNAIRGDRADGLVLANLATQRSDFNGIYVLETDGFLLDRVVARTNYEYGILSFAVDHGLITRCHTFYNGESGVYPGSASDLGGIHDHPAVEIAYCDSHHNGLGYSGTAGNSVYVHHNRFHHNMAGLSMDSAFPGHPGLPQNSAVFESNLIYSNNENYYDNYRDEFGLPQGYSYDGKEDVCKATLLERDPDDGFVCAVVPVPVGTGLMIAGGNNNLLINNYVWDNHRYAMMLFGVPAVLREEYDPARLLDTSHDNRFIANKLHAPPRLPADAGSGPNGIDFWWDEGGAGNCWQDNAAPGRLGVISDPPVLPDCRWPQAVLDIQRAPSPKIATLASCATFEPPNNTHPPGCTWMDSPPEPVRP